MPTGFQFASFGVALLVWALIRTLRMGLRQPSLPPGPPTIPVVGNAHIFPTKRPYLQFSEWTKIYGDMYTLMIGTQPMIILTSPRLVQQLLDLRTSTTSDRPSMYILDTINGGYNVALMRYGQRWKDFRRALRDMLSHEACMRHLPVQNAESAQLMYDLFKDPENFFTHVRRFSTSTILSLSFGVRCPRYENSYVSRFFAVQRDQDYLVSPGATPPVDMFPILKYVPERWAPWKAMARNIRTQHRALYHEMLDICIKRVEEDRRQGCYMEDIWVKRESYGMNKEAIAYLGSSLTEAGSDTSAVLIQSFICFMTVYQDAQRRARKELDDLIGTSRSPTFEDWESLPYLQAVIKEIHRIRPTVPTLVPHNTTAEERLGIYILPKGSMVFVNFWGINHDPKLFDEPEIFKPERFLKSEFGTKEGADPTGLRHDMVFGCGRRLCPGKEMAENAIRLNTMNLLWAFEFDYTKDQTGRPTPIDLNDVTDGVLLTQKPFKCSIRPRSQTHINMIRDNYATARSTFAQFEWDLTEDEKKYVNEW